MLFSGCVARETVAGGAVQLSQPPTSQETVRVYAQEYEFEADAQRIQAGRTVFFVHNRGLRSHELAIVPFEGGRYGLPVGEVEALEPGEEGAVEVGLGPGTYRLVCLLTSQDSGGASHMSLGQELTIEVTS